MTTPQLDDKKQNTLNDIRRLFDSGETDDAMSQLNTFVDDNADDADALLLKARFSLELRRDYGFVVDTLKELAVKLSGNASYEQTIKELHQVRRNNITEDIASARGMLGRYNEDAMVRFEQVLILEPNEASVPFAIALTLDKWIVEKRSEAPAPSYSFFSVSESRKYRLIQRVEKLKERCLKDTRERSEPHDIVHQKATQTLLQYWLEQSEIHPEMLALLENPIYATDEGNEVIDEMARAALRKVVDSTASVIAQLLRINELEAAYKLIAVCKPYGKDMPIIKVLQAEYLRLKSADAQSANVLALYISALKTHPLHIKTQDALKAARNITRICDGIEVKCPNCFAVLTIVDAECICNSDLKVNKLLMDRYEVEARQAAALVHIGAAELLKDADKAKSASHIEAAREILGKQHRATVYLDDLSASLQQEPQEENVADKVAVMIKDGITPSLLHQIERLNDQKPEMWHDLPLKVRAAIVRNLLQSSLLKPAQEMIAAAFSDQPKRVLVKSLHHELNQAIDASRDAAIFTAQNALNSGDAETAIQVLSSVMELDSSIALLLMRGKARMTAGHDSPALDDLYRVLSVSEDADMQQEARKGIAALLEKRWDLGGAQHVLQDALADDEVKAALSRVDRRKQGKPFIFTEQTNARVVEDSLTREEVDEYYYASFAVAIREVGRANLPYQFWTEKLIAANIEFVQILGAFRELLIDVTFALRFLCLPHPTIAERGQIKIALVARVGNRNVLDAEAQAVSLWNDLRTALPLAQEGIYNFDPIVDELELQSYLQPFEISHAAEIKRRESNPEIDGVYSIAPFVPASLDIHNLMWVLLRQPKASMVSLHLKPTQLYAWERDAALFSESMYANNGKLAFDPTNGIVAEGQLVSPEGATMPNMVSRLSQMNQLEKTRINFHRMNYLRSAFIMQINVVGQAGTSQLLPEMVASSLLGMQRDNGEVGGFEVLRALRGKELEAAKRNLRYVDVEQWGYSNAPEKTRRLRALTGEIEASHLFRLPMPMQNGIPGMRLVEGKPVSPPVGMPENGTVLGVSTARGATGTPSLIRQSRDDRRRHTYIVGKTGMGKSTLISSMALQDIDAGYGVFLLDPHGDLVEDVLMRVPKHRADDVILIDPSDEDRPIGLNILNPETEADRHRITNDFIGMLIRMYDPYNQGIVGPIFQQFVRNAMLAAMDIKGGTLIDVYRILSDQNYVRSIIPKITDPIVKNFWEETSTRTENASAQWRAELLPYLLSKFSRFVEDTILRRMLGQSRSSVPWRQVMDEGKIVLVNLAKGKIGSETSQFLGLLIMGDLLQAAFQRSKLPPSRRRDFYIYIDEVQNYSTPLLSTMISEGRKFGVSLVLANQFLHQLDNGTREAVFGNVGSMISFRVGVQDAPALAPEFTPAFTVDDLIELGQFTAASKLLVNGVGARAFTMRTLLPTQVPNVAQGEVIRELSRARYGTELAKIEREIRLQF